MQLSALLRSGGLLTRLGAAAPGLQPAAAAVACSGSSSLLGSLADHYRSFADTRYGGAEGGEDMKRTGATSRRRAPQGWWEDPTIDTAAKAAAKFNASLDAHHHLRQRHLQEIIVRCKEPADIDIAVDAISRLRRFRQSEQIHKPFNRRTSKMLVMKACDLSVPEAAAHAMIRWAELGLEISNSQLRRVISILASEGNLDLALRLVNAAREAGLIPSPAIAFKVARAAQHSGNVQAGREVMEAFQAIGVRVKPVIWKLLDDGSAASSPDSPPGSTATPPGAERSNSAAAASDAGPASDATAESDAGASGGNPDPAARPQESSEAGVSPSAATGAPPGVAS